MRDALTTGASQEIIVEQMWIVLPYLTLNAWTTSALFHLTHAADAHYYRNALMGCAILKIIVDQMQIALT